MDQLGKIILDNSHNKNVLIITLTGGRGHLEAAEVKADKLRAQDPSTSITQIDIFLDCFGVVGRFFALLWDFSQRKGFARVQDFFTWAIPFADMLFFPFIFSRILYTLVNKKIDRIIDTQNIGTSAIVQAIHWARKITKKPLILEKVLTELPTEQACHFFRPIKKLSKKHRSMVQLMSTTPLTRKNQTNEDFWLETCGLTSSSIKAEGFPLRPHFSKFMDTPVSSSEPLDLEIALHSKGEKELITNTIAKGSLEPSVRDRTILIRIEPTDVVSTILLGSQPTEFATLGYARAYIEAMRQHKPRERHLLFVFCNHHFDHRHTLLKRMHDMVQKTKNYPSKITIIPMCFQEASFLAPLYSRSQATFTRSGGLTSMELLSVAKGQIWIHTESRHDHTDQEKHGFGMPCWEWGNATYLKEKKGAKLITPDSFLTSCKSFFTEPSHAEQQSCSV